MVLGEDHLDTLMTLNDLASVLQDLGKQEEAEILHRRALEGRKEALGVAHWDTLTSLSNLALTLWDLGKREEAEAFHRQAVEGRELVLGRQHPDTLTSLNDHASILWALGEYEEGVDLYERVLNFRERELGMEHPETLTSRRNLELAFQHLRDELIERYGPATEKLTSAFRLLELRSAQSSISNIFAQSHNPYPREVTVSISSRIPPAEGGQTLLTARGPRVSRPRIDISHITQSRVHVRS
jgi:tetratricopeptide (TPR) repeat protein